MIKTKKDLCDYIEADRIALGHEAKRPRIFGDEIYKFQLSLRMSEYYHNVKGHWFLRKLWSGIYHHYSIKLGFDIPRNTFGKGLNIHHRGCIVVSGNARIGENCNIQQCVNIGQNYSSDNVPTIGNNVYIGPGAKIFGKVFIADGCAIGAGAIVNKSFFEEDSVIVGNPCRVVGKRKDGLV